MNAIDHQPNTALLAPDREEADSSGRRRELLAAAAALYAQRGYSRLAAADICYLAGVSRRAFYREFRNETDCLGAVAEDALERLADAMGSGAEPWPEQEGRVDAAVEALLGLAVERPASMLVLAALANGRLFEPRLEPTSLEIQRRLSTLFRVGGEAHAAPDGSIDLMAIGSALAMVGFHLARGDAGATGALARRLAGVLRSISGGEEA
jgi:AcrR family transcriptional regulator